MRILAVIPARCGSVGVQDKNIRPLLGRPMFSYTLEHLAQIPYPVDVAVSTDSGDYVKAFQSWKAENASTFRNFETFLRPAELRDPFATSGIAIKHVLPLMEEKYGEYHVVLLAFPSVPVRPVGLFDRMINMLLKRDRGLLPDSVFCLTPIDKWSYPACLLQVQEQGRMSYVKGTYPATYSARQNLPGVLYKPTGCGWAVWRDVAVKSPLTTSHDVHAIYGDQRYAVVLQKFEYAEIDNPEDLLWAEFLLGRR